MKDNSYHNLNSLDNDDSRVSTIRGYGYYVVRISEGISGKAMKRFRDIVLNSAEEPGLILDVSNAVGGDCDGIAAIMDTLRRIYQVRGTVPFVGPYRDLLRWFEGNNCLHTFKYYRTLNEAIDDNKACPT